MNNIAIINITFLLAILSGVFGVFTLIKKKDLLPVVFIISLATTAFFRVDVAGMTFFPYFFTTAIVFFYIGFSRVFILIHSKIFISFSCLILWTILVSIWRANYYKQIIATGGLRILLLMIASCSAIIIIERKIPADKFIKILYLLLAINSILGLLQYFTKTFTLNAEQVFFLNYFSRPSGFFPEPDALGKFCMVFIILLLQLSMNLREYQQKKYIFILFLGVLTMFVSHTRSAWIGFAAGIFGIFFLSSIQFKKKVVISIAVGLLIGAGTLLPDYFGLTDRFVTLSSMEKIEQDNSVSYRLQTIRNAIYLLDRTPNAWATGLGWFEPRVASNNKSFATPSNLFLFIIYRSGIIGLILCLFAFLRIIYLCARHQKRKNKIDFLILSIPCTMVAMLTSSIAAPMWFDPIFWLIIGLGIFYDLSLITSKKTKNTL